MNQTKTLCIDDPFRAAYLLRFGQYKKSETKNGHRCYLIHGDSQTLSEENYRYRTGYAMVNPLTLRESFYLLKELSGEDKSIETDLIESEDEEVIDLLTEEEIDFLTDE